MINDFPTYQNLYAYKTKGKHTCPIWASDTYLEWLSFSRKFTYRGHKHFLPQCHSFQNKNKAWFEHV